MSKVLGSNPVTGNLSTFAFFLVFFMSSCLHVCMCMPPRTVCLHLHLQSLPALCTLYLLHAQHRDETRCQRTLCSL